MYKKRSEYQHYNPNNLLTIYFSKLIHINNNTIVYPEKGKRKYAFITVMGNINNHNYKVTFQFRGTTPTDRGPRYCRILFTVL